MLLDNSHVTIPRNIFTNHITNIVFIVI